MGCIHSRASVPGDEQAGVEKGKGKGKGKRKRRTKMSETSQGPSIVITDLGNFGLEDFNLNTPTGPATPSTTTTTTTTTVSRRESAYMSRSDALLSKKGFDVSSEDISGANITALVYEQYRYTMIRKYKNSLVRFLVKPLETSHVIQSALKLPHKANPNNLGNVYIAIILSLENLYMGKVVITIDNVEISSESNLATRSPVLADSNSKKLGNNNNNPRLSVKFDCKNLKSLINVVINTITRFISKHSLIKESLMTISRSGNNEVLTLPQKPPLNTIVEGNNNNPRSHGSILRNSTSNIEMNRPNSLLNPKQGKMMTTNISRVGYKASSSQDCDVYDGYDSYDSYYNNDNNDYDDDSSTSENYHKILKLKDFFIDFLKDKFGQIELGMSSHSNECVVRAKVNTVDVIGTIIIHEDEQATELSFIVENSESLIYVESWKKKVLGPYMELVFTL